MKNYDVIFIGSGHACWHGALILKMLGKSVALVEKDLVGGTCTNYKYPEAHSHGRVRVQLHRYGYLKSA